MTLVMCRKEDMRFQGLRGLVVRAFMCAVIFGWGLMAQATNALITYQGRVLKPDGSGLHGSYNVRIEIYSPNPGRCLLWSEEGLAEFTGGAFAVDIGDISGSNRCHG